MVEPGEVPGMQSAYAQISLARMDEDDVYLAARATWIMLHLAKSGEEDASEGEEEDASEGLAFGRPGRLEHCSHDPALPP